MAGREYSSGSVFHLQKSLGHSSLDISRKYAQLTTEDLTAVMRSLAFSQRKSSEYTRYL